jgi:hypothetical protein
MPTIIDIPGLLSKNPCVFQPFPLQEYPVSQRETIDFNLAFIPPHFVPNAQEAFDPVDMKRLYDLGYYMARSEYQWENYPPMYHE